MTAGASLLAGLLLFGAYTVFFVNPVLRYDGAETEFIGKIVTKSEYRDDHAGYLLRGQFPDGTKAHVYVYMEDLGGEYGDQISLTGTFTQPENTALFSSKRYWFGEGVFLTSMNVEQGQLNQRDGFFLMRGMETIRRTLRSQFCQTAGLQAGGMMSAMLLGERQHLEEETLSSFYSVGIGHVLAVSGLHLVLLLQVWMFLARRWNRYLQIGGTVLGVILFALLVQTPVSVLRAGLMMLLCQGGRLVFRRTDTLNSLCIAGILLTALNPYLMMNQSFLYSFSGTFGVGVLGPWAAGQISGTSWKHILARELLRNLCVTAALFPVCAAYRSETSLLSPIANLFLLPLCMILLVGALLLSFLGWFPGISDLLGIGCRFLSHVVIVCTKTMQRCLPVATVLSWDYLPICMGICLAGILLLHGILHSRKWTAVTVAGSMLLLTGAQTAHQMLLRNAVTLAILGDSSQYVVVLSDSNQTVVLDATGNRKNPDYVVRYFQEMGISKVQLLCLTKRAPSVCSAYETKLSPYSVESVLTQHPLYLRDGQTICRQIPSTWAQSQVELAVPSGTLLLEENCMQFSLNGQSICIAKDSQDVPSQSWDYVVVASLDPQALPDCKWLMVLEDTDLLEPDSCTRIGMSNLQIRLQQAEVKELSWQK